MSVSLVREVPSRITRLKGRLNSSVSKILSIVIPNDFTPVSLRHYYIKIHAENIRVYSKNDDTLKYFARLP